MAIGLKLGAAAKSAPTRPAPGKRKPLFSNEDSEDEATPTPKGAEGEQEITTFDLSTPSALSPPSAANTTRSKSPSKTSKPSLKTKTLPTDQQPSLSSLRSTQKATENIDASLYDYDTFASAASAAQRARAEAKADSGNGGGQDYMADLLAAAETRKKDQLRAKDRLLQREREQEGDEFAEKDMFVTEAYKAQQADMRAAEEEEKRKEEEQERKKKVQGMSAFHRGMMDETDKRHKEALEAEKLAKEGGLPKLDAEQEAREKSEKQLAEELAAKGQDVELNDEGLVTDKRSLLSGGLNIVAKPSSSSSSAAASADAAAARKREQDAAAYKPDMDARRAQRDRQSRMMEYQLEQAQKRKAEAEAEEVKERERKAKSQKTEGEILSAKERYLKRKREAETEKARGGG